LYLSAITVAELCFGLAAMPTSKRRALYQDRLEREVLPVFTERVLPFDLDAAQAYAALIADARTAGRTIGKAGGHIAATTFARGFSVATRGVAPFKAAGLKVVNPWQTRPT
jgi:predicted nucleic acid-binding protein